MAFTTLIAQASHTGEVLTSSVAAPAGSQRLAADLRVTVPGGTFTNPADSINVKLEEGLDATHPEYNNTPAPDANDPEPNRHWRVMLEHTCRGNDQNTSKDGTMTFSTVYSATTTRPSRFRIRANSSTTLTYGVLGQLADVA